MGGHEWLLVFISFGWAIALLEFGLVQDQKRHIERLKQLRGARDADHRR